MQKKDRLAAGYTLEKYERIYKDIMSELNVQFFMADGTIQIKK